MPAPIVRTGRSPAARSLRHDPCGRMSRRTEADAGDVRAMDREEFSRIFKGSAMKRAKIEGMKRNAR